VRNNPTNLCAGSIAKAKYMIDSRKKTKVCTKEMKIPMAMIGSGAKKTPANLNRIPRTSSCPIMLPKSRKESDMMRAK